MDGNQKSRGCFQSSEELLQGVITGSSAEFNNVEVSNDFVKNSSDEILEAKNVKCAQEGMGRKELNTCSRVKSNNNQLIIQKNILQDKKYVI